ncbi:murein hydrolase activator EnvC family protein [Qipengyuania sediminis]|uniref:murein hydrolase activator EnvC family protein n=1 Tax=Qipengyuania sediminis TaxID=1532023 RepID=UPI001059B0F4|nr:M23 family metallopeptidase [Qipengyuania sediminis]
MRWHAIFGGGAVIILLAALAWPQARGQAQTAHQATLAAQARARAAALDNQARKATAASARAVRAAAALAQRVQDGEDAVREADNRLASLAEDRSRIRRDLAAELLPSARLAAVLALQARRPALLALLQPASLADTVRLRAAMASLTPQIEARTAAIRTELARAEALEARAAQLALQRRALLRELRAQRTKLAAAAAAERLKASRAAGSADREAERALRLAVRARPLANLSADLAPGMRGTRSAELPPAYRLPVRASRPGSRGNSGGAIVLAPAPNALVVSPGAGRVAFAGAYRGFGTIVIVEHPGGWTSLVTGLAAADVAAGQTVITGSPIGRAPAGNPRIGLELRRGQSRIPLDGALR